MLQIDCIDERPGTAARLAMRMDVTALTITAAALIRARVELEIERLLIEQDEADARQTSRQDALRAQFNTWLVRPEQAETLLNGDRGPYGPGTAPLRSQPGVPWKPDTEAMVAAALQGFEQGRFLLFTADKQVETLEQDIDLRHTREVVFLRLLPLAGG